MARCRCASENCTCQLRGGPGVAIAGSGAVSNPWVISFTPNAQGTLTTNDSPSLNLQRVGAGTQQDPFILTGHVQLAPVISFADTAEVDFTVTGSGTEGSPYVVSAVIPTMDLTAPATTGEVMTMGADGIWRPAPANVVDEGVIIATTGLVGDGSVAAPLRLDLCTYADLKAACAP